MTGSVCVQNAPDREWASFLGGFSVRLLHKGEHLLRQGEPARFGAIVSAGLLREYYTTPNGEEFTRAFCAQGSTTGSLYDLLLKEPAITSIGALEPSRLLLAPWAHFEAACARFPLWHAVARKNAEALFIRKVRREYEMLTMPARGGSTGGRTTLRAAPVVPRRRPLIH